MPDLLDLPSRTNEQNYRLLTGQRGELQVQEAASRAVCSRLHAHRSRLAKQSTPAKARIFGSLQRGKHCPKRRVIIVTIVVLYGGTS